MMVTLYVTDTGYILGSFDSLLHADTYHDCWQEAFTNADGDPPDCTFFCHN